MIAFAFFAVIAIVAAFYMVGFKQAGMPNKAIFSGLLAVLSLLAGAFLWPLSESYTGGVRNQQLQASAIAEADAARTMIGVLGSPDNYIRYLETKKEK